MSVRIARLPYAQPVKRSLKFGKRLRVDSTVRRHERREPIDHRRRTDDRDFGNYLP
jgi:hypothetical protein